MTFEEVKQAIITNTKKAAICDKFQALITATDYNSIIQAGLNGGIDVVLWCYQSGIITDDLLTEIPEADLNAAGIYSTGSFQLENPTGNIYVLKNADVSIVLNQNNNLMIFPMGNSQTTITLSGTAYTEIRTYNDAKTNLNISGNASCIVITKSESVSTINASENAIVHMENSNDSIVNYSGTDSSYANIKTYINSVVNVDLSGNAEMDFSSNGNSSVIVPDNPSCDIQITNLARINNANYLLLQWQNSPSNASINTLRYKLSSQQDWNDPQELNESSYYHTDLNAWQYSIAGLAHVSYDFKIMAKCPDGSEVGEQIITVTVSN